MPVQYTLPPDTRTVGSADPPGDMNNAVRALSAAGAAYNVLSAVYAGGADPTGVSDSAAALQAAVNALPASGGTIVIPPGTYKAVSTVTVSSKFVAIRGAGQGATTWNYTGSGDAFRVFNTDTTGILTGGALLDFTIDGTSAGAGACGLHYGDMRAGELRLAVQNFSGTGSVGVHFDNQNAWTEECRGYLWLTNCTQHLVFDVSGAVTSTNSFGYSDFAVEILAKQNQDGVVVQNGALLYNSRLSVRGNFQGTSAANTSAALRITGTVPAGHPNAGGFAGIRSSRLDYQAECTSGTGSNAPQTVVFGTLGSNVLTGCTGVLDFSLGSLAFATSNWTPTSGAGSFVYSGGIAGDFNLNNATVGLGQGRSIPFQGPVSYGKSLLNAANGNTQVDNGDFFSVTLSASITISLNPGGAATFGAAQRKILVLKQAASGGPFTVTWPVSGTPTTSAPTIVWPGGPAPVMPAAASAVLVVELLTYDGATWFGWQVANPPADPAGFAPSNPASTTSVTQVMMGLGPTCAYTPAGSGNVQVTVTGVARSQTAQVAVTVGGRYGTGTAPANGAAVTGTRFGPAADPAVQGSGAGAFTSVAFTALLALTPGTAYWFDLAVATANAADAASVANISVVLAEMP